MNDIKRFYPEKAVDLTLTINQLHAIVKTIETTLSLDFKNHEDQDELGRVINALTIIKKAIKDRENELS